MWSFVSYFSVLQGFAQNLKVQAAAGCHQAGRDMQVAKNQRNFTNHYKQISVPTNPTFPWQEDVQVDLKIG